MDSQPACKNTYDLRRHSRLKSLASDLCSLRPTLEMEKLKWTCMSAQSRAVIVSIDFACFICLFTHLYSLPATVLNKLEELS